VSELCEVCYGCEPFATRKQAEAPGRAWAEHGFGGELRAVAAWPEREPRTLAASRRLVGCAPFARSGAAPRGGAWPAAPRIGRSGDGLSRLWAASSARR